MIYTVICVNTFEWECKGHPESDSLSVYKIEAEKPIGAASWAREFLTDEFGTDDEWRVVAVMPYQGSVMDRDGLLIETHDVTQKMRDEVP